VKNQRHYSVMDQICLGMDQVLRAVCGHPQTSHRPCPGKEEAEPVLTREQQKHSAALMRINHAGEVCAQALYHGQGLASRSPWIKEKMQQAMHEEGDHLAWCQLRLQQLGSHTSYLNPVWYAGSFVMGLTAGWLGDKWSLGFLAETEAQVVKHLQSHLQRLPVADNKSYKILMQMQEDESHHQEEAIKAGAAVLPEWVKKLMHVMSRVMVMTTRWV